MSASVALTRQVLLAVGSPGPSWEAIAARSGLDLDLLDQADARIPHAVHLAVWREAERVERSLPMRVAELLVRREAYGVLGYALASSPTLQDAWSRLRAHARLLYDEIELSSERRPQEVALRYRLADDAGPPALFEAAMASLVLNARRLTGGRFRPLGLRFKHRLRSRELEKRLETSVRYGQDENAVLLEPAALELPVLGADPALGAILDRYIGDLLKRLPCGDPFLEELRRQLVADLPGRPPTVRRAARRCALSPRTLQRRLNTRGLTFRKLVDDVRRQAALEHLANRETTVAEVGFALGFTEGNAFHRAFRRWMGVSPGAYRARPRVDSL